MKKFIIQFADTTIEARSEANMWTHLRTIRDHQVGFLVKDGKSEKECKDHATVTAEDGTLFKDIVFRLNSKGKVEMVNLVKETCRKALTEARKAAKEAAAKAEARKAKKREADRRYRARKKAQKEAVKGTVENTVLETEVVQKA